MRIALADLDLFYISYDEPLADERYRDLCAKAPRPIKRVHGIRGIHAAHKACAEQSETSRFVTIDADNIVSAPLFFQRFEETEPDLVLSYKARNAINGLEYGQGGVKVWPRPLLLRYGTHEIAEREQDSSDFCFAYRFLQMNYLASTTAPNGNPLEAFRTGYREAVKLTLIMGKQPDDFEAVRETIYPLNLSRLTVWASVGADVENGWWAIYGARQGLYDLWVAGKPVVNLINDFPSFNREFDRHHAQRDPEYDAMALLRRLAPLNLPLANLDAAQSRMFKAVYHNPERQGIMLPQMEPVPLD
ncbi:MAG: hypothetical protein EOP83_08755 [Verrucomicrobiaceae bacterium]|nr:MAG: hypothetical protein EOP83_08755 [Verrucomicrobiaceae bacterium]